MNWLDFREKYDYHCCKRSCGNCKHEEDYDDEFCKCRHPLVKENDINLASYDCVCDLWEQED